MNRETSAILILAYKGKEAEEATLRAMALQSMDNEQQQNCLKEITCTGRVETSLKAKGQLAAFFVGLADSNPNCNANWGHLNLRMPLSTDPQDHLQSIGTRISAYC